MKYQNRKRLMMTEAEIPVFSGHASFAGAGASAGDARAARPDRNAPAKEFRLQELTTLSLAPIFRGIHHWWLKRAEQHYLICADVEEQRAREAQQNVAYYQKRAAMARSARL
jgi:hypothetical protein